jgi:hypothetical protein
MSETLQRLVDANVVFARVRESAVDHRSTRHLQTGIDKIHEAVRTLQLALLDLEIHYQQS